MPLGTYLNEYAIGMPPAEPECDTQYMPESHCSPGSTMPLPQPDGTAAETCCASTMHVPFSWHRYVWLVRMASVGAPTDVQSEPCHAPVVRVHQSEQHSVPVYVFGAIAYDGDGAEGALSVHMRVASAPVQCA